MTELSNLTWYLAQTKPNAHRVAQRNLERQRFHTFLPAHEVVTRKRGKMSTEVKPLFPGYIFVGALPQQTRVDKVNNTFGVSRLVAFGSAPAKVPDRLIRELHRQCDDSGKLLPPQSFATGSTVKVTTGPFSDLVATVEKMDEQQRVWVLLDILGKDTRVAMPPQALRSA